MRLPTYQELAALIVELTERNVANLDSSPSVRCFAYSAGDIPPHWKHAMEVRRSMFANRVLGPKT